MASDESLTTMVDLSMQNDENDDTDDGLHQNRQSSLSRLSVCTSSIYDDDEDDDVVNNHSDMGMFMSRLSLESFDGVDADGEVSDTDKDGVRGRSSEVISSDSDKEPGFYSLPTTPPRRRRKLPPVSGGLVANKTDSEDRDSKSEKDGRKCNLRRERRAIREKTPWMDKKREYNTNNDNNDNKEAASGESDGEHGGEGGGLMVLTRPKGGKRSLCMGFEEVKACRDLGFELEVIPGRASISPIGSGSTVETQTSSDGNSPIPNWRISSPGDDPKEVKARLKVWAQAVALASTSRHVS